MYSLRIATDLDECQQLWQRLMPRQFISDLWEVRFCFQRHFQRPPCFIVAEGAQGVCGFLPLSWIEERQCYGYFPGETWEGKTWLEQNRIIARDRGMLEALLSHCPGTYHLRYLLPTEQMPEGQTAVDEIGYLFVPPQYDYDMERYFQEFSHKSAKRVKREISDIENLGVRYRCDEISDFDILSRLNMDRFGARSYFYDRRFFEGFRSLAHLLSESGWLRLTTVLIGDEPAAVDMGCVYDGVYTLLGGGTNGGYPGVAKLINTYHMHRACRERFEQVDFLCGNFSWKNLFHLKPRPLYLISNVPTQAVPIENLDIRSAAHV